MLKLLLLTPLNKALPLALIAVCSLTACSPYTPDLAKVEQEFAQHDYLGTIVAANALLHSGDTQCRTLVLRAAAYRRIQKEEKALLDLHIANQLFPQCSDAALELARLSKQRNDTLQALHLLNTLVERNDSLATEALIERALLRFMQDRFDAARIDLELAIHTDSLNAMAWYYKGYLHSRFFDPDGSSGKAPFALFSFYQSLHDFNMAIRLMPQFADAWFQRGLVQLNRFNDSLGLADLRQAIRLDPTNGSYHTGRAEYYQRVGNTSAAIADADSALRLNPNDFTALEVRAAARRKLGDLPGAQSDAARAKSIRQQLKP